MQVMRIVGLLLLVVLALFGLKAFQDKKKIADAEAADKSCKYFMTLISEDTSQKVNNPNGGPQIHPWILTKFPTQLEIQDQVGQKQAFDGETFAWKFECDPDGGTNVRKVNIEARFDSQGKLNYLGGIKGKISGIGGAWSPD